MSGILRIPRGIALAAIALLIGAASLVSFAESYRGLFLWAHEHGLSGAWSAIWPLQVDVFIAVGELALFIALIDRWQPRSRTAAWVVTGIGLAVSVAGNVGHVAGHALTSRVTAAVPPLAAAAALAVGLGVLKRIMEQRPAEPGQALPGKVSSPLFTDAETAAAEALKRSIEGGNRLSDNQLKTRFRLSRTELTKVCQLVTPSLNGSGEPPPDE